jgi:hypothetical protein
MKQSRQKFTKTGTGCSEKTVPSQPISKFNCLRLEYSFGV